MSVLGVESSWTGSYEEHIGHVGDLSIFEIRSLKKVLARMHPPISVAEVRKLCGRIVTQISSDNLSHTCRVATCLF
jgi:hypothetical protein